MALHQALAHRVRSVCQTGGDADPAVAHRGWLLARSAAQLGQSRSGGTARGRSAHGRHPRRSCWTRGAPDHALHAFGLSDRETQAVSQYSAAAGGSTGTGGQASAVSQGSAPRSGSALASRQGVGVVQAAWQDQLAGVFLNLMPMWSPDGAPTRPEDLPEPNREAK